MAGTISLSLSQQFNQLGAPLSGGKLWFYAANTTTPQDAFQDYDLTIEHPNPITLDSAGRVPAFYLADGFIKIRLTDSAGVTQVAESALLVVGPSSGSGGGGGVDPTTIFQTGDCMWLDVQGSRTGWVRDNGRSIGSATSGASERANADTQDLFIWLWTNFSDTICPVSTGRGANALADFEANKTITLPDKRGYVPGGLDDMGNSAAGRYANVPVVSGTVTTAGSVIGEATHALSIAELAAHDHGGATGSTDPAVTGGIYGGAITQLVGGTSPSISAPGNPALVDVAAHTHTISSQGSGTAHNTVQKTVLGTYYRKL